VELGAVTALAIPTALDRLELELRRGASPEEIALPLRALQMRGLSKLDMVVHLESLRAVNQAQAQDEDFDERCLLALDIAHGNAPGIALQWDAAHQAAALLPRTVSEEDLRDALDHALEPSDLLPPRPAVTEHAPLAELASQLRRPDTAFLEGGHLPSKASYIRAPKDAFTSRPAALLTLPDRLIFEALVNKVDLQLDEHLPDEVTWPRTRGRPQPQMPAQEILGWGSKYIVKADVAQFYESIEHVTLALFLSTHVDVSSLVARCIESLLGATMGMNRGLPQGPPGSEILGSAYLLPIDRTLVQRGERYVRYADDYFFPASTFGEGRAKLQLLESLLRGLGLSLNGSKTRIMRKRTFEDGLRRPSLAFEEIRTYAEEFQLAELEDLEASDEISAALEAMGVDEQTLWDLLYHQTVTVDQVVADALDAAGPHVAESYGVYFKTVAKLLRQKHEAADFITLETVARECLVLLATTDTWLRATDVRTVQTWFPQLTPQVVNYLITRPKGRASAVARYFERHFDESSGVDWVDAWMCYGAGCLRGAAKSVVKVLRSTLRQSSSGVVRIEAFRALSHLGKLQKSDWAPVTRDLAPPLKSELILAGLAAQSRYPWLQASLPDVQRGLLDPPSSRTLEAEVRSARRSGKAVRKRSR
jgi:Reverse transcriptase (RNA-dependent DNA polymerase)